MSLSSERGQTLIFLVLCLSVTFVVGAIVVDIGLWLSERRGSQTDADFSATAGAFELLDPAGTAADAVDAAEASLADNDEQGNASLAEPVLVDDSCYNTGEDDAVTVNVEHASRSLFFGIFGLVNPDIGAHAKACVGAAQSPGDVIPFQIDDNPGPCFDSLEQPEFTEMCPLELGAQSGNPRGMIDLEAPDGWCSQSGGNGDIQNLIEWGAPGPCLINPTDDCDPANGGPWSDCVAIQSGNTDQVLDGTHARLLRDGQCDANFGNGDGVDDFFETVDLVFDSGDPLTSIYEARDCEPNVDGLQKSSRIVTIIVLEDPPPTNSGGTGFPIVAFAGMYIAGCTSEGAVVDDENDVNRDCDNPGGARYMPDDDLFVSAPGLGPLPRVNACHQPNHQPGTSTCAPTASPTATPTTSASGSPTVTATATPTPSTTPSASPSPSPPPPGPPGHDVVWGRFVKLIVAGAGTGPPTDQTTLFGISLVE